MLASTPCALHHKHSSGSSRPLPSSTPTSSFCSPTCPRPRPRHKRSRGPGRRERRRHRTSHGTAPLLPPLARSTRGSSWITCCCCSSCRRSYGSCSRTWCAPTCCWAPRTLATCATAATSGTLSSRRRPRCRNRTTTMTSSISGRARTTPSCGPTPPSSFNRGAVAAGAERTVLPT